MYPPEALGEFFPNWLIEQAEKNGCKTIEEIHRYGRPRMDAMGMIDRGPEWLAANYKE